MGTHVATDSRDRFGLIAGIAGIVLCCLPFYVSIVPPLADLPAHVLVARVLLNFDDPVLQFSEYFAVHWTIAPTSLFYAFMTLLQKALGPIMDARVYLTIWVTLTWLGVAYLASVLGQRKPWDAALLALPLAFCGYAYQGYLPFLMGFPLFAFAVAIWFNGWKPAVKLPALWIVLLLLFGFHIVGAAAAGAAISTAELVQAIRERELRTLVKCAAALTPLLLLTVFYLFGQEGPSADIRYSGVIDQVLDVVKFTAATLDDRAALLMLAWLVGLFLVFLLHWHGWVAQLPLLWAMVAVAGLSVAMPGSLGALWPAGPRLLPFALILLVAGMPWDTWRMHAPAAVGLLLLVGLCVATTLHVRHLDAGYRDILSAIDHVQPGKRVLPIMGRPDGVRWTSPYQHAGDWVTSARGGTNPFVFATPYVRTAAAPLIFRLASDAPLLPIGFEPKRGADFYRAAAKPFDYVLTWGDTVEIVAVRDAIGRDKTLVYQRGHAHLFARQGLQVPP